MNKKITKEQLDNTIALAQELQSEVANAKENIFEERIGPIAEHPKSKTFLIKLMDTAFRSSDYNRIARYLNQLFKNPVAYKGLFKWYEGLLVSLYKLVGNKMPKISIPVFLSQIKKVTNSIVFYVGDEKFNKHSDHRRQEGVKLNVNLIGETLVGEGEAEERIEAYKKLINDKNVDYISIKISTIYSHISAIAYDHTVNKLVERLTVLYDEVLKVEKESGTTKFINLDMEEYRDMSLTVDAFIQTLSIPRFKNLRAGIVLQAYIPDSYNYLLRLQEWAIERVKAGGAPIKIRIVKGANMEMEMTESSLEDWPLVTFEEKTHSDANYKKMLLQLLTEESCKAVNLGIASHNVFDLSFAITLVKEKNLSQYVDFEMLEGMANAMVTQLLKHNMNVLLYTPIVHPENYINAIAYLVRRLDEGTAEGNFLKESLGLNVNTKKWEELKQQFITSVELIEKMPSAPKRHQDRSTDKYSKQINTFHNVPNTDWILKANQNWIQEVKNRWSKPTSIFGEVVKVVGVAEKNRETISQIGWNGEQPWKYELADAEDYKKALEGTSTWYTLTNEQRINILRQAAVEIENCRGDLIGVAVTELGKMVTEVDVEVSEAIDFANYYAYSVEQMINEGIEPVPGGISLVLSPWNFPVAIPCGGVLASLAAGKRVILKPSQNAAATAYLMCNCLWKAGIPKDALLFLPAQESNLDEFLTNGNVFDAVILTGGTDTAKFLLNRNPRLNLYAETGGKNSTIVTSLSDKEQAIKNVVNSAFGNTGQKCSATSLLILEKEVFENKSFKKLLKDAVESRIVGNPWNFETQVGPLAVPVSDKLKKSIETTPKEQWMVEPKLEGDFMLSPGVKWGVTPSDFEYQNELFGPVLSVMKANNLEEAVKTANGVEYGLTSGLESLDQKEIEYWLNNLMAGNLYVNRGTTGAIVQRQPFGGMKASCFGFGMKAGGPNYVLQFVKVNEDVIMKENYQHWYETHFNKDIDYVQLRGQHNINVYLKPKQVILLVDESTSKQDINLVLKAAKIMGVPVEAYSLHEVQHASLKINKIDNYNELESKLNHDTVIRALNYDTLPDDFLKVCHSKAIHVYGNKPTENGRIEFLNYLNEQNRSINYHRYGNLMGIGPHQ
ncbi:proline dehydrogenase family protein [Abyssalbus ytuae]|uniref:L-glutamate gamma-semialdehyde dehydrogenase n=1 Tax=Abyssalbus ytuae TaxID=2926907 RepID=A0A9E7D285_9FLAO|nr:bifunctional proline dehydrogenase/L-glutamate gamma-semialdehyde dehydrogenase [Abyssalbus ytuae]UOB16419.1 bifunctional proline dehydrogenase/L-glutamate gamma-semialdehyde dehydrogenase [Abyssalbus ytuae]